MSLDELPITFEGYEELRRELERKKNRRIELIELISSARDRGDLSENAEYHSACEEQSFNNMRIVELEDILARSKVIDIHKLSGDVVTFGAYVSLIDNNTDRTMVYRIVGTYEAANGNSVSNISIASPLARALIGKRVGDMVDVNTPSGIKSYEILAINFE